MSRGLNKIMIIGQVGRVPELRYTPTGTPVAAFSVAVGREWTTASGEAREATEWFNVVAWGSLAEQCHVSVAAGQLLYVEGSLQTRTWDDSSNQRHHRVEVVAEKVNVLSRLPQAAAHDVTA